MADDHLDLTSDTVTLRASTPDDSKDAESCTHYVLGGGRLGTAVARRLRANGRAVRVVDDSYHGPDHRGVRGDPTDVETLKTAGIADASIVIVATRSDRRNLLIAQLVRTAFEVPEIVVLANRPDRECVFVDAGYEPICVVSTISDAVVEDV